MRQKLLRFEENKKRPNIVEYGKPLFDTIKGHWRDVYFENTHPITLELGCGNGEYTNGLAQMNPSRNFIGIDYKGDRLYNGSGKALGLELENVAFLRTQILNIENFFAAGEVDEIWLTFPDPRPRDRDEKRRLTFPRFLNLYQNVCVKGGWFRFKTDNTKLFEFTLEVLDKEFQTDNLEYTFDLYQSPLVTDHFGIKTKYENIWTLKGEKIKYLKFQFK